MKKTLRTLSFAALAFFGISRAEAQEPLELVNVDFTTLFAGEEFTGTVESPNYFTSGSTSNNPITNVLPGWSIGYTSNSVGQAGEALYISNAGNLESPSFGALNTSNGGVKITIVAKSANGTAGNFNMNYGTRYSSSSGVQNGALSGNEWQTLVFYAAPSSSSFSNFLYITAGDLKDGILVQSIRAEQYVDYIYPPTAFRPEDADGSSFTARWSKVTSAVKYYIDVYYMDASGRKVYYIENQETEGTTYKVTGLDPDKVYYYMVRAESSDGVISTDSAPVEVIKIITELGTPEVSITSVDAEGNFTASWDRVTDADSYIVDIIKKTTLTEDRSTPLIDEDFSSLTGSSLGILTSTSFNNNFPGWSFGGYSFVYGMKGALALSGNNSYLYGQGSYLTTPEMDLSGNDGNVKVSLVQSIVASYGSTTYTGTMTVSLMNGDTEADAVTVNIDKTEAAEYSVELTGGTSASKIKFYYPESSTSKRLKFEKIEVLQSLPAGSVLTSNYLSATTTDNSYTGKVEIEENTEYLLTVTASARTVVNSSVTDITSAPSAPQPIDYNTNVGIDGTNVNATTVKVVGPGLVYVCADGQPVEIFDLLGRKIASQYVKGESVINIGAKGIVIVKAGNKTAKLML